MADDRPVARRTCRKYPAAHALLRHRRAVFSLMSKSWARVGSPGYMFRPFVPYLVAMPMLNNMILAS